MKHQQNYNASAYAPGAYGNRNTVSDERELLRNSSPLYNGRRSDTQVGINNRSHKQYNASYQGMGQHANNNTTSTTRRSLAKVGKTAQYSIQEDLHRLNSMRREIRDSPHDKKAYETDLDHNPLRLKSRDFHPNTFCASACPVAGSFLGTVAPSGNNVSGICIAKMSGSGRMQVCHACLR